MHCRNTDKDQRYRAAPDYINELLYIIYNPPIQVLDEVDRILEEVKHDWLRCVERAVYDRRGWPLPLTAAR